MGEDLKLPIVKAQGHEPLFHPCHWTIDEILEFMEFNLKKS